MDLLWLLLRHIPCAKPDKGAEEFKKFFCSRGQIPSVPHGKNDVLAGMNQIQLIIMRMTFETAVENE